MALMAVPVCRTKAAVAAAMNPIRSQAGSFVNQRPAADLRRDSDHREYRGKFVLLHEFI